MDKNPVNVRRDYGQIELRRHELMADPVAQLRQWIDVASQTDQLVEPTAMSLATVDADGRPSLRTVLLRRISEDRLLFFTNYTSRKANEIAENEQVALLFRWADPQRQVEVRGTVAKATVEESDAYFASRPRASQIGAHVSPQSQALPDRATLDEMVDVVTKRFDGIDVIPRPDNWGGFAVTPETMEFWQGRSSRLHDRFRYRREPHGWSVSRLAP